MPLPTVTVTPGTGQTINTLPNAGQAASVNSLPVVVASDQSAVPVSASALPLPTGAATAVKQPAPGAAGTPSTDVITVQGAAGMTAVKVDGSATTQPVSGTVTVSGVAQDASVSGILVAQGATTSGEKGPLV